MKSVKLTLLCVIGMVAVVGLTDITHTVRIKTFIVKLLPFDDRETNMIIQDICAAAFGSTSWGATSCYLRYFDREAALRLEQYRDHPKFCSALMEDIISNPSAWITHHNHAEGYFTYIGKGKKPGFIDNTYNLKGCYY